LHHLLDWNLAQELNLGLNLGIEQFLLRLNAFINHLFADLRLPVTLRFPVRRFFDLGFQIINPFR
jgi:hypothetical protein